MSEMPRYAAAVAKSNADSEIKVLEAEIKRLHLALAGEKLRADQGWERYEAANQSRKNLEAQLSAQSVSAVQPVPLSIPTPVRVKAIAEANGGQEGECEWHFPRENLMDFAYALMTYSVDKYVAAQSTEGAKG